MREHKLSQILLSDEMLRTVEPYNIKGGWDIKNCETKTFKETMKRELFDNQNGRCAYCDLPLETRNPEIDHIAPKGGNKQPKHVECTYLPLNLVYACHNCNSSSCKGSKDTVVNKVSTNYSTWIFSIVHPYLDDPVEYFYQNRSGILCPIPKKEADEYHRKKALGTIKMFGLDTEGKLNEIGKQLIAEQQPDIVRKMIENISTYKPNAE